jgi:hypothetical protein
MTRFFLLLLFAAFSAQSATERGALDPAFDKIPFDKWLGETDQSGIHWTVSVPKAELSFHQRLVEPIQVTIDGRDLDPRRSHGKLGLLVQITDGAGTRFQDHDSLELGKLDENVRAANIQYTWKAFVVPGEYRLAVAIVDTSNGDHSAKQVQFKVVAPQHDPLLTDAWRDLPPVEFLGKQEPPDGWFLPAIEGKLAWAASVHSPARVNVILNVAPSVPVPGTRRPQSEGMAALIPTLKAISQTGSPSIVENVELLDLARRKAVFQQKQVHDLDWPRLQESLGVANTASIDVHSLSERHTDAQFFVSQVRSMLRGSEAGCVLVVLTKPVAFDSGEDLEPISTEGLPDCRVVYIRYTPAIPRAAANPFDRQMGGRRGRMGGPMQRGRALPEIDQLEATLKPLKPKVYDVEKPEQITKAMAEILKSL